MSRVQGRGPGWSYKKTNTKKQRSGLRTESCHSSTFRDYFFWFIPSFIYSQRAKVFNGGQRKDHSLGVRWHCSGTVLVVWPTTPLWARNYSTLNPWKTWISIFELQATSLSPQSNQCLETDLTNSRADGGQGPGRTYAEEIIHTM